MKRLFIGLLILVCSAVLLPDVNQYYLMLGNMMRKPVSDQALLTTSSPTFVGLTLTGLTASRALTTNGSKVLTSSATTDTELGYVSGVTSAIQTQLGNKEPALGNPAADSGYYLTSTMAGVRSWGQVDLSPYLKKDGTVALTGAWAAGVYDISALDISANGTFGSELVIGGTAMSTWAAAGNWTWNVTKWDHATGSATALVSNLAATANTLYKVVIGVTTTTAGTGFVVSFGGISREAVSTSATFTYYIHATSTAALTFTPGTGGTWVGSLDSCSVKAITSGNVTSTGHLYLNGSLMSNDSGGMLKFSGPERHEATMAGAGGNQVAYQLNYTTNKGSGNDTGFQLNMTDSASPGTSYLMDLQVGGTSKFTMDAAGAMIGAAGGSLTFNHSKYESNYITTDNANLITLRSLTTSYAGGETEVIVGDQTRTNTSGWHVGLDIVGKYNQASGTAANTDLRISRTETAVGSGTQRFVSAQVTTVEKAAIDNRGAFSSTMINNDDSDTDEIDAVVWAGGYGLLIAACSTDSAVAVWRLEGTTLVALSVNALFTAIKDNAATYNVYFEGGSIKLQNKVNNNKVVKLGFYGML